MVPIVEFRVVCLVNCWSWNPNLLSFSSLFSLFIFLSRRKKILCFALYQFDIHFVYQNDGQCWNSQSLKHEFYLQVPSMIPCGNPCIVLKHAHVLPSSTFRTLLLTSLKVVVNTTSRSCNYMCIKFCSS